jgi:hypothetical protein
MKNAGEQTLVTSYTSSVGIQLQTKGQTALPPANSENLPVTAGRFNFTCLTSRFSSHSASIQATFFCFTTYFHLSQA